ncbi:hypothetical protein BDV32DRAFT_125579 [Aspergillus pseudonomiae]|uniref:Uncharacterized protein n=1 Tax=Aspergillus pseudonomiae TaxID=1506151 RepID=A0A5N6HYK9_9EURO|nr:uncharacterized protein BDV37DRAFT_252398 [Aspergillus pseudonomiae]KAB8258649.1 hypothetical protein BDV32DRAFT_125579 [Aspergillus pseudonomiae]KAE8402469.1 hypothetical protein BDV37DRAFT_252398 [Aspergillus pseudonomiae]
MALAFLKPFKQCLFSGLYWSLRHQLRNRYILFAVACRSASSVSFHFESADGWIVLASQHLTVCQSAAVLEALKRRQRFGLRSTSVVTDKDQRFFSRRCKFLVF